jgi:signal transduction histidine kinase/ActR/RegA family two-component response regulator
VIVFHKLVPLFVLILDLLLLGSALATHGRSERNRSFAYLSLALAVWAAGVLGLRWTDDPQTALVWEWVLHAGVVMIPVLFYQYVWVLLGDPRRGTSLVIGYVLAAGFLLTSPTPWFMTGVRMTAWGFAPAPGPLYPAFVLYFIAYMAIGLAALLAAHRRVQSTFRRNRLRLVIVGVTISLLGGLVDFGRFLLDMEWLYPPAIPASAVFAVALGVAIVRYRLMSVSVLGKRILLYAVTWAAMTPAVLAAFRLVDEVLPRIPGLGAGAPTGTFKVMALLTLLTLAMPFMRQVEVVLDRLMFRRQRATAAALVALDRELLNLQDVPSLARGLTAGLATRIPVVHAALYGPAPEGEGVVALATATADAYADAAPAGLPSGVTLWMRVTRKTLAVDRIGNDAADAGPGAAVMDELERAHVALVVPVMLESELTALLVVGEKLSGEVFEPAEIELLEVLAGRIATALRNARLFQDLQTQMKELRTARSLYGRARQADRAKEEFLAMLAHELRNPLAPIVNAAQVLQTLAGHDPKAAAMIGMIRRQAQRLARIVDDLLDVSRIQLGKIRLDTEVLDLRDLVEGVVETLRTSGKGHGREIRAEVTAEPLPVRGDAVRLEQVFWNLLDNALKYSPPASPVSLAVERDGDEAVVRIADRGIGIAPDVLPRIFELFTQADTSLHRSQGGLGLGLALVRSLVDQHHGTVTATSAGPGQGSEFAVRLPLVHAVVAARPDRADTTATTEAARRVLVVEDAVDSRESLRVLLEMLGNEVQCAEDGVTALAVGMQWAPDVAIVDIGLPDIDGYQLARRLREMPAGRTMYLVALTGYGQPEDRRRALDSGFDAHFVKPIDSDDLRRIVAAGRHTVDQYGREAD